MPTWLREALAEGEAVHYLPSTYPTNAADVIGAAVAAHTAALVPASDDEIRNEMAMLSTGCQTRNESPEETRMAFELLVAGLRDVPADILRQASAAWLKDTSKETRFFPRSSGEFLRFCNGPLGARRSRLMRLSRMREDAKRCEERDRQRERDETSWTEASIAEANADFARLGLKTRYRLAPGGRAEIDEQEKTPAASG